MYKMSAKITAAWKRKWPLFVLIVLCVFLGCASKQPAKPETAQPESSSQEKMIHSIDVSEGTGTARVTMHATSLLLIRQ